MAKQIGIKLDTRVLDQLEQQTPGRGDQIIRKVAYDFQADVQDNFSNESPSAPGDPPGVVTGFLKNAITVEQLSPMHYAVIAGTDYAPYLEFGTVKMAARPFMQPAAYRIVGKIPDALKALVVVR